MRGDIYQPLSSNISDHTNEITTCQHILIARQGMSWRGFIISVEGTNRFAKTRVKKLFLNQLYVSLIYPLNSSDRDKCIYGFWRLFVDRWSRLQIKPYGMSLFIGETVYHFKLSCCYYQHHLFFFETLYLDKYWSLFYLAFF